MRIAFLNPQGNFDSKDSYWTEHPDFGGQLVYVKEVAIAMARLGVDVDIITRQIIDDEWKGFEEKVDSYEGVKGVRIIRIPFGGKKFLNKEELWSHIHEYVTKIIDFYEEEGKYPDFFTTHYGDGGIAGALLYDRLNIPYTFTGHSLGAQKMDKLNVDRWNIEDINRKYKFAFRIVAERISMGNSAVNIVSTDQEQLEQYSHRAYKGAVDVQDHSKFAVIPPGVNIEMFNISDENDQEEVIREKIDKVFQRDILQDRQGLPAIIAASRLDPKKNHIGLVKAYSQSKDLQEKCNLAITLRGIDNPFTDYSNAKGDEKEILDQIMSIIKEHKLEGKVTMFSLNSQKQLAACYREFAKRKSIFALTALYEPFGLAPIEAMACGLPAVVTKNGGPSDVLREGNLEYGVLIDPTDPKDIAEGVLKVLHDEDSYERYQKSGLDRVNSKYTWNSTAKEYIKIIKEKINERKIGKDFRRLNIDSYFVNPEASSGISVDRLKRIYLEGEE